MYITYVMISYRLPPDSQPENTKKLCSAVVEVAQKHNQFSLLPTAQSIDNKFQKLFNLFGACHKVYDSADILENSAIDTLGKNKF